jgi:hypothetical protein
LSQISGSEGVIVIACPDCIITVDSINLNNLVTGDTVIFSEKTSTEYIRSEADTRIIGAYRTVVESEAPLDLTVSVQIELSSIGSPTMNGLHVMLVSDGSYSKELSYTLKDNTISINVPSNQLFALVQAAPSSVGNDYGNLVIVSSSLAIMIIALLILSVSRKT